MEKLCETASQTAGPYVHIGCVPNFSGISDVYAQDLGSIMITDKTPGDRITIAGKIFDGVSSVVKDAMVEIWQADSKGIYPAPGSSSTPDQGFTGWGRRAVDPESGEWRFDTIKPGRVAHGNGFMAPHITMWIVARGINIGLHTRLYFPEEAVAHATDPVLARIEHKDRVQTLIALPKASGSYRFNIHLQGPKETVFFDV
ncbi:MAG: protocatechuate 3,4-dioxygenase subunit alpha [Paracoccaceae bacterium]|nr:protocatechuate 3,4-dioxygenase subunit alpha [Paracoccaceae bacterium]